MKPSDQAKHKEKKYLEHLLALSKTLNSSLNLEEVLNMATETVVDFLDAERGFIMLVDHQGELVLKAYQNVDPDAVTRMEGFSKTILQSAAREGKSILSLDARRDQRFKDVESVMLEGMRSVLCVPLKVDDRIIGVIYLDHRIEEQVFDELHLKMLEAFSNQAVVAIENAKLHENLIKSYDEKIELTRELATQEKIRFASEEANRQKSEFVNIVSHELRSPLTVIKTYTSTLNYDLKSGKNKIDDHTRQEIYQTIDREVDRLLNMINKLLDVSRIDEGKSMLLDLIRQDIKPIIEEIVKLQSTSKFFKQKKHSLVTGIEKNLPEIVCDREKVTQILLNLVENALKYSPDGGEVRIDIHSDENNIYFEIIDHGLGLTDTEQKKLFRKFQRIDNKGRTIPGTGLGLYLIKHLVELHRGEITVRSEKGKGSIFKFYIPRNLKEQALINF
ncbi:MAG: ATP-binding protein [Vulcanimicrobiota bacterium]